MNTEIPNSDHSAERARTQVGVVRGAFGTNVHVHQSIDGDDASAEYLHRANHVLVDTHRVGDLAAHFQTRADTYDGPGQVHSEPIDGLTVYALPERRNPSEGHHLTHQELDAALGAGVVTPDHVIYLTNAALCPATEPEDPTKAAPWPALSTNAHHGSGIHIGVVDTGLWTQATTDPETGWMAGVTGDAENINPGDIHPYGGHGTFVAGVIRCQAPASDVHVYGMLTNGGAIFESELVKELDIAAFSGNNPPKIIAISGGTHTRNDHPLKSFEALAAKHQLKNNTASAPLIVAAAGNDARDKKFWPAAFEWVVGVGSVDTDDAVSDYSNYGHWVDIYALGRDHVNAYPDGRYVCYEPPNVGQVRNFDGLAKWSGTSFATPLVAGVIAATMTEHNLNAHDAWAKVKADATKHHDARAGEIKAMPTPV